MGLDNSSIAAKWPDVLRAIRNAKIEVVGEEDIGNDAHAQVLLSVIRAFGTSPIGFIFVEPCTRFSTIRPPDVLLCHPEVGLLVFEVKGYQPENIHKTIAGKFQISQKGRSIQVDPFRQASDAMFNIKNSAERFLRDAPLCNFVVVLPNVPRASFEEREFHQTVPMGQLLLKEDLDENCLRQKIGSLVRDSLKRRGDSNPLTHEQILGLRQVFGDSAVINSSRQGQHHSDESTLGALIDELDVQDKHLSREQLDLSRLRIGTFPRLIRGVAGSGKTVVLANLVARTLTRELGEGELFSQDERRELKIGVMCFNSALVPLLRQKIKDAFLNQTGHELNSNFVYIIHLNKLMWYLKTDLKIPIPYFKIKDFPDAKDRAVRYRAEMKDFQDKNADWYQGILFDAIFVDEGQDFEEEELQLLLDLLKPSQR